MLEILANMLGLVECEDEGGRRNLESPTGSTLGFGDAKMLWTVNDPSCPGPYRIGWNNQWRFYHVAEGSITQG